MAQRYRTQKLGEYADGLLAHAAYVRDVQARLSRPGFRQMEIDDAEGEHAAITAWMRRTGKQRSACVPAGRPWA